MKKQENQVQMAIRVPESWLPRLDKIAEQVSPPGVRLTRTEALRTAIHQGMVKLETEGKQKR